VHAFDVAIEICNNKLGDVTRASLERSERLIKIFIGGRSHNEAENYWCGAATVNHNSLPGWN